MIKLNWIKNLNNALTYIENHLTEELDIQEISKEALSSYHHFSRTFHMISGMTLGEYIRKRRLTKAAADLISGNDKVIDLAMKYQYKTPESFTKAFKEFHGVTPRDARKLKGILNSLNAISFQLNIGGLLEMKYQLVQKDHLTFSGYTILVTSRNGQNFKDIPNFWQSIMTDGRFQYLMSNSDEMGVVGVIYDWNQDTEEFKYMIGISTQTKHESLETITFEQETFAAFEAKGALPNSLQNLLPNIYKEWFPSSNYEHSGGPEIEVYPFGDGSKEDYICYYWIPIKQKEKITM